MTNYTQSILIVNLTQRRAELLAEAKQLNLDMADYNDANSAWEFALGYLALWAKYVSLTIYAANLQKYIEEVALKKTV